VTIPSASELRERAGALPAVTTLRRALGDSFQQPVFLVGGAVRDLMLGREPLDLDLAVEGPLTDLKEVLGGSPETHDRFATATVTWDGVRYDLAQTRTESYAAPGALPDVRPATIAEDLARRDFTVNAIAFGLAGPQAGELLPVDGALDDLEARRLAVLHDASFVDDPTRLLRLARYQARLGFEIASHTRALADAAIEGGALVTVSGPRIGNELRLLASEAGAVSALAALADLGLDRAVDPAFTFTAERRTLARDALAQLPTDGRPDVLLLGVALLGAERGRAEELLDRLGFTAADRDAITQTATTARSIAQRLQDASSGSEIARIVGNSGVETMAVASALLPSSQARRWLDDLRHRSLEITGNDLIAAGIPEGPQLGRRLSAARDAMLDDQAPDRERQLEVALNAAR
jgi:tRNA nucleotidyltransferase (CCA-adding enzyme)